jgi:DNA-directed RNA polymerase specialized sigma24 family protein
VNDDTEELMRRAGAFYATSTPEGAFDALHAHAAPALIRQVLLLTGSRRRAFESVEFAFRHAWQHWPEVCLDSDPVRWLRARAHEYALSPWHRLRRSPPPGPHLPGHAPDVLRRTLLLLPPQHRRTVVLCDGLGLTPSQAAAEMESSTQAAVHRLRHARAALSLCLPAPRDASAARSALRTLLAGESTATMATARSLRLAGERRAQAMVGLVCSVVVLFIGLVTYLMLGGA